MNIVIVEDEHMAANRLTKMVQETDDNLEVVSVLESIEDAVEYFNSNEMPDLIFMDIQLADGVSFEIFDLVEISCPVVFTTAYDEFAVKAFRVHAIDYLLKPIKSVDIQNVIGRVQKLATPIIDRIRRLQYPGQEKKVLVKLGQKLKVLNLNEAAFYYSENKISFYMDKEGKRFPVDYSLDRLEELLNMDNFYRVNRQYIVNETSIEDMVTYSVNRIKLHLKPIPPDDVIVSKDKVSRFRKWLVT